ncbi:hypothetical protein [Bdellovibrio reynosensis]|uniref:Lipocalin-like domain-containing protein n=1 Tax=Bdellovibrio reynosensis TaxID=2835041 RepID=A0ABY4CCP7_9BACT|nr:hypothetical protein [Bdellovibrio reynosensis]UOF02613.1 hypothetical protein MNR06_06575 [Bdellovibrio reynosensis]
MKQYIILSAMVLLSASCNTTGTSGSTDLGSITNDVSYHTQNENPEVDGEYSYAKIELKANNDFEQSEAIFTGPTSGTKCTLTGTWAIPTPDVTSEVGNELVATITHVNGVALGTPVEKRYELSELSTDTLKVKYTEESEEVDLTNVDHVTYTEYSEVDTTALTDNTFCNR